MDKRPIQMTTIVKSGPIQIQTLVNEMSTNPDL